MTISKINFVLLFLIVLITLCIEETEAASKPTKVYLRKMEGHLRALDSSESADSIYTTYFLIPVPFREQRPILVEVESPQLVDYRFIHLSPPNVIVSAQMRKASSSVPLHWTTWVLVIENTYSDLPDSVSIPTIDELPDSVKKWLMATDCVQVNAEIVQQKADSLRGATDNLMVLAENIRAFCDTVPWTFLHKPNSFDAVYTLNWGNSCTGHAHAGAALFRANGIPARSLLNMPAWGSDRNFDMHWIIDYFVPDYGWVTMETSLGRHPAMNEDEIITLACNPEDEFPLFFACAIEGYWHTSDPALGPVNPNWEGVHYGNKIVTISAAAKKLKRAYSLTGSVFHYYSYYHGIKLASNQIATFKAALKYQRSAIEKFKVGYLNGYISDMKRALARYRTIDVKSIETIFFDDFDNDISEWTHGGDKDEWELGAPKYGPAKAHSGENCWGMDLDSTYENNADCWLMSPRIDLTEYNSCAYLSFWVWNYVEDNIKKQGAVYDPLWLDITTDGGTTFSPLCNYMGGVNDDPEIPDVGGWANLRLDLYKYIGKNVQIRFRFGSNEENVQPGSYIDDFFVYGRKAPPIGIEIAKGEKQIRDFYVENYPDPFSKEATIKFDLLKSSHVVLNIYDINGKKILTLTDQDMEAGYGKELRFDASDIPSGIYFYRLTAGDFVAVNKMVVMK